MGETDRHVDAHERPMSEYSKVCLSNARRPSWSCRTGVSFRRYCRTTIFTLCQPAAPYPGYSSDGCSSFIPISQLLSRGSREARVFHPVGNRSWIFTYVNPRDPCIPHCEFVHRGRCRDLDSLFLDG